jgi:hypothetical protein
MPLCYVATNLLNNKIAEYIYEIHNTKYYM